jgi:hypothetical protein
MTAALPADISPALTGQMNRHLTRGQLRARLRHCSRSLRGRSNQVAILAGLARYAGIAYGAGTAVRSVTVIVRPAAWPSTGRARAASGSWMRPT